MFLDYIALLREISFFDILDILCSSAIIWFLLTIFRSRRTWKLGAGLVSYGLVLLLANQLEFTLTVRVLQGLSVVVILIVVVIYQQEIRRVLDDLGAVIFRWWRKPASRSKESTELLINLLYELSERSWGALIVLPGEIALDPLITEGFLLNGQVSRPLLLSLFDPGSPGHDGAVVMRGDRVERFGSRLPLTERDEPLNQKGTRHAAALGLAEKCDALILVVSEESGAISIAYEGELTRIVDRTTLKQELTDYSGDLEAKRSHRAAWRSWLRLTLRMVVSLVVTAIFWVFLVPGSAVVTNVFEVPIDVQNVPAGFSFDSVSPPVAEVVLRAERRELFNLKKESLVISLDGTLTGLGRQTYPLNSSQLVLPPDVDVERISPATVKVLVNKDQQP